MCRGNGLALTPDNKDGADALYDEVSNAGKKASFRFITEEVAKTET